MLRHTATSHGTQLIEDHPRAENRKVEPKTDAAAMNDLLGRSITYRVAVGPRAGENGVAADPERAQPSQTVLLAGHASESGMKQSAQIPKQSDFGICA